MHSGGERAVRDRVSRTQAIAYRTDNTYLGDGHIGFSAVLIAGLVVLVPVISWTTYCTMRRSRQMVLPAGFVSISVGVVTAIGRPGNLFVVEWFMIVAAAVPLLLFTEAAIHRLSRR
jgi:hypothetical protein